MRLLNSANKMFNFHNRLYASTFVNTFGSWLTFLAIALVVKEKYGAEHVAIVFLVQTLPAVFFPEHWRNLFRQRFKKRSITLVKFYWGLVVCY